MKKFLLNVLAIVSVFLVCGNLTAWGFDIVHHKPSPAPGKDYEVVYTTLADMKSFNAAGWAVDGSGAAGWSASTREIKNWIDPKTDDLGTGNSPVGIQFKTSGTKMVKFYVTNCSKIKAYMGGQSSDANGAKNKIPVIKATSSDGTDEIIVECSEAIGQSEYTDLTIELDKSKSYEIYIYEKSTTQDCKLYAMRLYGDYVSSDVTTYTISSKINIEGAGTVTMSPQDGKVVEGNSITLNTIVNDGYAFLSWTDAEGQVLSTENPYTFKPTKNMEITANLEKLSALNFDVSTAENAIKPESLYGKNGTSVTIPNNVFVYNAGKTFVGWSDGTNEYKIGDTYTFTSQDITLTPLFEDNAASLKETEAEVTVKWTFATADGAPTFEYENGTNWKDVIGDAYYVVPTTVNGKNIDVAMQFETRKSKTGLSSNGKINNASRTDLAQVNPNTVFNIPVTKGCIIELSANKTIATTTIDGSTDYTSGTVVTYTYNGSADVAKIVIKDGSYYKYIKVTYPVQSSSSYTLTTEDTDYYSLYLDYNATVPENVTAYTGSLSADQKTLVLSQITDGVIPANQGVLVKSTVAGNYTFNQSATDPSATSVLKGVTTATEVSALEVEGKTVLTLGIKNNVVGFRKPAGGIVGANKAYLLVDTPTGSAAPELVIGIDDDETTGINGVKTDNADVDAPMFNIAGQRVSNNAKGLVIKNGKKYMLK